MSFRKYMQKGKEGHLRVGKVGEEVAAKFLVQNGFEIKERNYSKKWGELDIVAVKDKKLHFVEVKTLSWDSSREESGVFLSGYRPEDNVHPQKLKRLARVTESYLASKRCAQGFSWQFDVAAVFLDLECRVARVKMLWDLILPAR
ncbi:MAG: putative endonuclease [Parcubacteria group bacterium Gr01-1014_17]|nr:MAG: putative endonuclease [Parcubacteria group bacterium Gr01-1014_17]